MKKTEKICYMLAGVCLILGALMLTVYTAVRFTGFLFCCAAAALMVFALLTRWKERHRWALWARRMLLALLAAGFAFFAVLEVRVISWARTDTETPVTAVIVLGAGVNGETPSAALRSRINAAAAYLETHSGVPVVLSGGQGPGEAVSEAEAMYRALSGRGGLDGVRWVLEDRSTSTAENFRFSKALLREQGLDTDTAVIAVVTNDFHCFRAHLIAQRQGLRIVDVPAELPWWWLTANYYVREAFAVVKTVLFDR